MYIKFELSLSLQSDTIIMLLVNNKRHIAYKKETLCIQVYTHVRSLIIPTILDTLNLGYYFPFNPTLS